MINELKEIYSKLNKQWGENIKFIDDNQGFVSKAHEITFKAYESGIQDNLIIEISIILLENNNLLFHKKSDYQLYQKVATSLYELIKPNQNQLPRLLLYKFYSVSVYADYIFDNQEVTDEFEINLIKGLEFFKSKANLINEFFIGYINISQFYLFKGELNKVEEYLFKAYEILKQIQNKNYQSLFWYHLSWIYVEKGDYKEALKNIENFFNKLKKEEVSTAIYLHALNIYGSIKFQLKYYEEAKKIASKCYNLAKEFYETEIEDVIAENLLTIGRCYFINKNYSKAYDHIKKSIYILENIFSIGIIDPSQAVAHRALGEVYLAKGNFSEAYNQFNLIYNFYENYYEDKIHKMFEVSNLYISFIKLGIKINDYNLANKFFKLLVANYPQDNKNLKEAYLLINNNGLQS